MAFPPASTRYDEIYDFLLSSPSPEEVVALHAPENLQQRLDELLELNRQRQLSVSEQEELDDLLRLNRFIGRLKVRARQKLAGK